MATRWRLWRLTGCFQVLAATLVTRSTMPTSVFIFPGMRVDHHEHAEPRVAEREARSIWAGCKRSQAADHR